MLIQNPSNRAKFRPFGVRLAALASAAVLIAACGSDDDDDQPAPAGAAGTTSSETDSLQPTGGSGGVAGSGGAAPTGAAGTGNGAGGSETQSSDDLPNVGGAGNAPGGYSAGNATPDAGAPAPPAGDAGVPTGGDDSLDDGTMTFFVTSRGGDDGANFGGLDGADAFCTELATAASPDFARRTWHAYLSTTDVDARDRIGAGPWRNQAGVVIANSVTQLHDQLVGGTLDQTWPVNDFTVPLDETGAQLAQNVHDILAGSDLDGTLELDANGNPLTCSDWTSNSNTELAQNGHTNRAGLAGQDPSWNSVHQVGCAPSMGGNFESGTVTQGGGRGSIYCFAVITGQ